jgi:hypothetical protein
VESGGIPHLPKPGRYGAPVIRYAPGREKFRLEHHFYSVRAFVACPDYLKHPALREEVQFP